MNDLRVRIERFLKARRMGWGDVPLWLFGMLLAVMWSAPFVWMVSTSLKPFKDIMTRNVEWLPRTITFENYAKVFEQPVAQWMINSLIVAVVATLISVMLGALAGYALARLHFPGRGLLFGLLLASIMIPGEMTIVPLYVAFLKIRLTDSYLAIILPFVANVFSVYIFRQFFMALPRELEEAAAIDGATRFGIFWRVAFPLARSPTVATTILLFTSNWNAFLWPLLIVFSEEMKTMPVGIAEFAPGTGAHTQLVGFGPAMAGVTLLSLPSLLIFLLLQQRFIEGVSRTGIKG